MKTKNKIILVLILIAMVCGISMLVIGPHGTLDTKLFYSQSEAYRWLTSLTPEQRSAYLLNEYLDMGYLLAYTGIFILVLGPIGFIPGILDLVENVPIILYLLKGSELPVFLGIISGVKWISGVIVFGLVVRKLRINKKVPGNHRNNQND